MHLFVYEYSSVAHQADKSLCLSEAQNKYLVIIHTTLQAAMQVHALSCKS